MQTKAPTTTLKTIAYLFISMQVFFKEILYLSLVVWQLLWTHITNVLYKENVHQLVWIGIDLATQGWITKQQVAKEKFMGKPCKSNRWLDEFSWGSHHSPSHQHLGASLIFLVLGVGVQDGKISALVSLSACHKSSGLEQDLHKPESLSRGMNSLDSRWWGSLWSSLLSSMYHAWMTSSLPSYVSIQMISFS